MRILFVAMAMSVHTARWVRQLLETGWDIHVFDLMEGSITPELRGVTAYTFYRPKKLKCNIKELYTVWPFFRGAGFARRLIPHTIWNRLFPSRVDTLQKLILRLKPDILHSMEMQHETYPLLEVKKKLGGSFKMPWIYSSWGSDLYFYGSQQTHCGRIKSVLSQCDYYIADCHRDIELAKQLGFKGQVLGVFPGVGGFETTTMRELMLPGRSSARRVIALKGYEGWAGRALVGLRALELCAELIQGYTVEIFSASPKVQRVAHSICRSKGIHIKIIPQSLSDEVVKLMGRTRLAIGLSISDGTPNSMLEAMIMGAFPIQSGTSCADEWIENGKTGLIVPPEDPEIIAAAISRAVTDDALVDSAAEENMRVATERLDRSVTQPQLIAMYEKVAAQAKSRLKKRK
jgi:glycosyltransferase involved in cell wall biosynthesis